MTKSIPITAFDVQGKGNSLWGSSSGQYTVNRAVVRNFCDTEAPYELRLFGENLEPEQYTDSGIQEAVNTIMLPILREMYPAFVISKITWSEWGMQPDNGWSFDIVVKNLPNSS